MGFPSRRTTWRLLEKLSLEGFQSGLSWRTILAKRADFRVACRHDPRHHYALRVTVDWVQGLTCAEFRSNTRVFALLVSPASIVRTSALTSVAEDGASRRSASDQTLVSTNRLNGVCAPP